MIKKISAAETHDLRKNVLGDNITDYQFIYEGDDEETTYHLGYFKDEKLVGILTIMQTKENVFQFRGMAVSKNCQGENIGKELLDFATDFVKPEAEKIWLNARKNIIPFYLKSGFNEDGELFYIQNIGLHLKMSKLNK